MFYILESVSLFNFQNGIFYQNPVFPLNEQEILAFRGQLCLTKSEVKQKIKKPMPGQGEKKPGKKKKVRAMQAPKSLIR